MESGSETTDDAGVETTDRSDELGRTDEPDRSGDDRPDQVLEADSVDSVELRCGISLGDASEDASSDSSGDSPDDSSGE